MGVPQVTMGFNTSRHGHPWRLGVLPTRPRRWRTSQMRQMPLTRCSCKVAASNASRFFLYPSGWRTRQWSWSHVTSWLQDQRFWPSCVKHPSFIRNLRAKIWDLSCVKGIRDLTSPRFWLLKLQWLQLQGFNWESHQAGKGNWYGIVESKVGPERDPLVRQWMRDKTLVGWWSL